MLDAIALYLVYRSSRVISLRLVTTDLDLLSYASRKGKINSDLIRNTVLFWNNVVLCAIFKHKRVWFQFLHQYAVFCAVLKSIFFFFIKCMQPMTMALSRRCMYAKLHVTWSKSLLYIFSLINHIDSLCIQALSLKPSSSYSRFSLSLRTLRVLLFRF